MRRRNMRWVLAAVAGVAVAFVALGGPVAAKNFIDGGDIAPGTVGGRQIANGAVSIRKLSRRARRSLGGRAGPRGAAGAAGPAGPAGAAGAAGARGPAGAYNFVDRTGAVIGRSFGYYSGVLPEVVNSAGAVIVFDNDPSTANAFPVLGALYYAQAACAGTPYVPPGLPPEFGVILASPASPGSQVYKADLRSVAQSFTAASSRGSGGCVASTARLVGALEAIPAGTVPAIVKPLAQVPAG